jgi:GTP cyclohydrolase III
MARRNIATGEYMEVEVLDEVDVVEAAGTLVDVVESGRLTMALYAELMRKLSKLGWVITL